MIWQSAPYAAVLLATAVLSVSVATVAWLRRGTRGSVMLGLLMLMVAEWALCNALELMAVRLTDKVLWATLSYIGIVCVPLLWLLFVILYTEQDRGLRYRYRALLWFLPIVTVIVAATNQRHGLLWSKISLDTGLLAVIGVFSHGPWFWLWVGHTYLLLLAASGLLLQFAVRSAYLYRRQATMLLVGASFPWLANLLYIAGLVPVRGLDLTPSAFALSGLLAAWSILRFHLLDLAPAARDALFEGMSDGVLVLDAQNRIVDINPAGRRYIGGSARLIGQNIQAIERSLPDLIARYRDVSEARTEFCLGGNPPRYLGLHISPLYDRHGRLTGRSIVFSDITKRKQVDADLRRAKQALEAANQELARRLVELDTANMGLQVDNAELQAFAHTVAHDLKNPLAQILGYADMLSTEWDLLTREEIQTSLQIIARTGWKMNSIIHELLLLAEVRKADVVIAPLEMAGIVREAMTRPAQVAEERGAYVSMPDTADWPVAVGYGPWVEEVWVNYIGNTLKYGGRPDRMPYVPPSVELGAAAQADGCVHFWVRDNGRGLTDEERTRLFAPFERLSQARALCHGLGLSIVRRIAERLGGQVAVESVPSQGSTFSFTLPAADGYSNNPGHVDEETG